VNSYLSKVAILLLDKSNTFRLRKNKNMRLSIVCILFQDRSKYIIYLPPSENAKGFILFMILFLKLTLVNLS